MSIKNALASGGWLVASVALVLGALGGNVAAPQETVNIVPASGVEGFIAAEEFCRDPATKVTYMLVPDAGLSYEAMRTKDGVTESVVTLVGFDGQPSPGVHWYNTTVGQQKEPAVIDKEAAACFRERGVPKALP